MNGKYGLPLTLHSMIGLNDMDQKVCDQDAEKKKRNREIPWIIKGKEIDIAEGDKVLLNKQRCKKQADTVVIN